MKLDLAGARPAQGGIEQNQSRVEIGGRQKGDDRRKGMKDADGGFVPVDTIDRVEYEVMVAYQGGNIVVTQFTDAVPSMVSDVIDDQLVVVCKQ